MSDITRAQLGKANRALKKTGNATPTEGQKEELILFFLSLGIDPALETSSVLAKKFRLRQTPPPPAALSPVSPPPTPAPKTKTKAGDETNKTRGKVIRGLRKAGYPEASELLITEALNFFITKGINPLKHASKTLANRLRNFKPRGRHP
jgi:hypothetical protein